MKATGSGLDTNLSAIKENAAKQNFRVTQHAQQEMSEENILLDEVLEALLSAQILEDYPQHRRGACCLVYGITSAERPLHIVWPKWESPSKRGERK